MAQEESVLGALISSTVNVLLRVIFRFEPLAPIAITLFINRQLNRYKEQNIVSKSITHTKRLGKYHYSIEMDLDLTGMQALHLLGNLFPKQLSRYRRWFHD
ncbi:MAG: hypothetical protein NWE98_09955 [Candidatus Bathyarchaeota archaeon]|nr:hypothetical protein [Candidatus Bathyarchaeota archaeon]